MISIRTAMLDAIDKLIAVDHAVKEVLSVEVLSVDED